MANEMSAGEEFSRDEAKCKGYFGFGALTMFLMCVGAYQIRDDPFEEIKKRYAPTKIKIIDVNGDGIEDIVLSNLKGEHHTFLGTESLESEFIDNKVGEE